MRLLTKGDRLLIEPLVFTAHAVQRISQRNLKKSEVGYVLRHGSRRIVAGAIFYFLGRKHVPVADRRNDEITRLIGTSVLVDSHDGRTVLTAYRNPAAPKRDRRKSKYSRKPGRAAWPAELPLAD